MTREEGPLEAMMAERDEAREELGQAAEALHAEQAEKLHLRNRLDQVRTAISALDSYKIAPIARTDLLKLIDAEPVTDCEEPAEWKPAQGRRVVGKLVSHPDDEVEGTFIRHSSDWVSRIDIGADIPCQVLRATLRPASDKPASVWDVEADTHRISEDHEEPAPVAYAEHERVLTEEIQRRDEAEEWADKLAAALAPPHVVGEHSLKNHPWRNALEYAQDRPWASEEPAGETKPRTLLGWTVPDHVHVVETKEGVRLICAEGHQRAAVLWFPGIPGDARALAFLQAHAHGRPVERQADSEAQR